MSAPSRGWLPAVLVGVLLVGALGLADPSGAQETGAAGVGPLRQPFVSSFREQYDGVLELVSVARGRLRATSDVDPRPRTERVVLLRIRAMTEGCTRLTARVGDEPERVHSITVHVLPREAAVAVPRNAGASERLRVSVGDVVLWPLPEAADATFLPRRPCDDGDADMRTLLAGGYPGRSCALEGGEPPAWRLPAALEPLALRCHFASPARGEVTTTVERIARIRRAGRVQGDLTALAAGAERTLVATHVLEQESAGARPLRVIAYVPTRRVVRTGDWVLERRGDVEALDEDLLACLHERDTACRVRARPPGR